MLGHYYMTKCCFSHASGIVSYITLSEENLFSIYMNCTEEMCIRFTELYNYWNTVINGVFIAPYINIWLLLSIILCFFSSASIILCVYVISLFIAQSRPLQLLQAPFYLYHCKAFKLLEKLQLHVYPNLTVGFQEIQQNLLPRTFGLMQIFSHVVSIDMEEELPWFRVIAKKIPGIRWPSPPLLHQDQIQAHHQVIHSIFFQAAKRIW